MAVTQSGTDGNHPTSALKNGRSNYLDNIKWVLAVLVILHHAAAVAGRDPFPVHLPQVAEAQQYQYHILLMFQSINQGFFMSLFFFISAYFVIPSYERKGAARFMRDKLKRLGIPLLLTIFLIDPLAFYISGDLPLWRSINSIAAMYGGLLKKYNMMVGVTWFCWALIVFSAFYAGIRTLRRTEETTLPVRRSVPSLPGLLGLCLVMIPFNFGGRFLMQAWGEDLLGFHHPDYFPMYIVMFYGGIQAYKYRWLEQLTFSHAFTWIIIWICARTFLWPIDILISRPFEVIGMSIFLLYAFQTLFNTSNRWSARLSRSAYAAYVVQVIPLCLLGKLFIPYISGYPILNFFIVAIPSVVIAFGLGWLICHLPILRNIF